MSTLDNAARPLLATAIRALNDLVVHLNAHPETFPSSTRAAIIEADYMLNSAADDVADFIGSFPAPEVAR